MGSPGCSDNLWGKLFALSSRQGLTRCSIRAKRGPSAGGSRRRSAPCPPVLPSTSCWVCIRLPMRKLLSTNIFGLWHEASLKMVWRMPSLARSTAGCVAALTESLRHFHREKGGNTRSSCTFSIPPSKWAVGKSLKMLHLVSTCLDDQFRVKTFWCSLCNPVHSTSKLNPITHFGSGECEFLLCYAC